MFARCLDTGGFSSCLLGSGHSSLELFMIPDDIFDGTICFELRNIIEVTLT